jgi:GTPase SAR1 family protein
MDQTFLQKYQPQQLSEFKTHTDILNILNALIKIDSLNILFIGDVGCGKTAMLKALVKEYYNDYNLQEYQDNIMYINNLE